MLHMERQHSFITEYLCVIFSADMDGSGLGHGDNSDNGSGYGDGFGDAVGDGYGDGSAHGSGNGNGVSRGVSVNEQGVQDRVWAALTLFTGE